jgi:hypothetical protein
MKILLITLLLISISINKIFAQDIKNNLDEEKHTVLMSVGAPVMYLGLTYEYKAAQINKIKILPRTGIGFNIFQPSLGSDFTIHAGIGILYGNKTSKLEIGLGLINYFTESYDFINEKNTLKYKAILYEIIAFRYELKKNPLMFKIGITPILIFNKDKNVFIPLAEIGIGYRF